MAPDYIGVHNKDTKPLVAFNPFSEPQEIQSLKIIAGLGHDCSLKTI